MVVNKPLGSPVQYVIELAATDNKDFTVKQVITVTLSASTSKTIKAFLLDGTRKGTLIADLRSMSTSDVAEFRLETGDGTVRALFELSNGQIVCGQDVVIESIANDNVIATEIVFNVTTNTVSGRTTIAEVFILLFKDSHTAFIDENVKDKTIATYSIASNNFKVTFASVSDILGISIGGSSISVTNGLDYETKKSYTLKLNIHTKDNELQTEVKIEVKVNDVNDETPHFDQDVYEFEVLAGSYNNTVVGTVSSTDKDTVGDTEYRLDGQFKDDFTIDQTGIIRVNRALQKSRFGERFNLSVIANNDAYNSMTVVKINLIALIPNAINLNKTFSVHNLKEGQNVGTFVTNVKVTNYTDFTFANPGARTIFNLNPTTGDVTTAAALDRENARHAQTDFVIHGSLEEKDQCFLVILGHLITVLQDVNDNSPKFVNAPYTGHNIKENSIDTPVNGLVDLQVSDDDEGENANVDITLSGADSVYFKVDQNGNSFTILSSNKLIDRETQPYMMLTVTARDNAPVDKLSSTTVINITVDDVNDNKPSFTTGSTILSLNENMNMDTLVVHLSATDADAGANAKIYFSIIKGGLGFFHIDSSSGLIRTTQKLDRETHDVFNLTVLAKNEGSPSLTSTITVTVNVLDVNDNNPIFEYANEPVTVTEEQPCNSPIFTVSATDQDEGINSQIEYSVPIDSPFTIQHNTGEIRCKTPFDYETQMEHTLTVTATDKGASPLSSSVKLIIAVTDTNDNSPQFDKSSYSANMIRGEWYSNKPIFIVTVTDSDSGINSNIKLSLSSHNDRFTISGGNTGVLQVKDTATKPSTEIDYSFNIIATDGGSPAKTSQTQVTVHVSAEDNTVISFNAGEVRLTIEENVFYNNPIGTITVKGHPLSGARVKYSLVQGDDFTINEDTGELNFTTSADRETVKEYVLIVRANGTDNAGKNGVDVALVKVSVTDVNDNEPVFEKKELQYFKYLSEDAVVNSIVIEVTAKDRDAGANGTLTYSIEPSTLPFSIHKDTGVITVARGLNREKISKYTLTVKATDGGGKSATTTANISLLDVNDNSPEFSASTYTMSVREDATKHAVLGFVTATDKDYSSNGIVTYLTKITRLGSGSGVCPFSVTDSQNGEEVHGQIEVSGSLDYETTQTYECLVIALDMPECTDCSLRRTSTATLTVNVDDSNDNRPVFQGTPYSGNISRSVATGTTVTNMVTATDADSNYQGNGYVTYFIASDTSLFNIDRNTGEITVASSLEAAPNDIIKLTLTAKDNPNDGLDFTATTTITIYLYNVKPLPYFNKAYIESITEEQEPLVFKFEPIQAYVRRKGGEKKCDCTYNIRQYTGTYFKVDSATGVISQTQKINREETGSNIYLGLTAIEKDTGYISIPRNMTIDVNDINDNKPYFTTSNTTFISKQTDPPGTTIGHLSSVDRDASSNPQYFIEWGDNDYITLMKNGTIKLVRAFGNETKLEMLVKVNDSEIIQPSFDSVEDTSRMGVIIEIRPEDYNEYVPVFTQSVYEGTVQFLATKGTPVAIAPKILATDRDEGDTVKYRIQSGNPRDILKMDATTARVTLQFDLEDSIPKEMMVVVIAVDSRRNAKTGTCKVKITVSDHSSSKCITGAEYQTLELDQKQRTIFLGLFIALAVLLCVVSVIAVVAIYKWRISVRHSRYRENIDTGKNVFPLKDDPKRYDSLSSCNEPGHIDYNPIQTRDFSAEEGTLNPAYVSTGSMNTRKPPNEPATDYM